MTSLVGIQPTVPVDRAELARPNVFEIDLGAIGGFAAKLRASVGPNVTLFAALKSNAYGFGLVQVAQVILDAGADGLAVVDRAHAVTLRREGIVAPILLFPGCKMDLAGVRADAEYQIIPTISQLSVADLYSRQADRRVRVAVKIEVGKERLGVADSEAVHFIKSINQMPHLEVFIVNAHADVPARSTYAYLEWQFGRFVRVCEALEKEGVMVPVRMFASSQVLGLTGSMMLTGADPGMMFFGVAPHEPSGERPAFHSLKSQIIHARSIDRSDFLEQSPFPLRPGMRVGIIPIGSSDGMASLHCGEVLVGGRRVKVLGKPSLEYTRIDLTEVPEAAVGDEVVLIGRQGECVIAQEEVVAHQRLDGRADLAMAVRSTIPRRYLR